MQFKFQHFIILNILDVLTTYTGLTYLGLTERNEFASGVFETYGLVFALVSMKIVGLVIIYGICALYTPNTRILVINVCCLLFMVVILNNVHWIFMG